MEPPVSEVGAFLARFTAWANDRSDIRGVLLVGSRARSVEPADPLSDIDLLVVTSRPSFYVSTRQWLQELGDPVVVCLYSAIVGTRSVVSVDFDGGGVPVHVDFAIVGSLESRWGGLLLRLLTRRPAMMRLLPRSLADQITSWFDALSKGAPRVLVDKGGAASRIFGFVPPQRERAEATTAEWEDAVSSFLDLCLWESKLLLRNERWMAAHVADRQIKDRLLKMLEWHARAAGGARDTWYTGRFVERWAEPQAVKALPKTFGSYDRDDAWRAIFATMDLFSRLGHETASRTGHVWPEAAENRIREWVQRRFDGYRGGLGSK